MRLEGIEEQDDVFMLESTKDFNFLSEIGKIPVSFAALANELKSDNLATLFQPPLKDLAERALPNKMKHMVIVHI